MPDVYSTYSYDSGLTWSTPTLAISGATIPCCRHGHDGAYFEAGYVPGGTAGQGTLAGRYQSPGDPSLSAQFTLSDGSGAALPVYDGGFALSHAADPTSSWLLTCTIVGEAATSNWRSTDQGRTWTRV